MDQLTQLTLLTKILSVVLSISGFFGAMAVIALFRMAKDINEIKSFNQVITVKYDQLNADHKELKTRFTDIEKLIIANGKN